MWSPKNPRPCKNRKDGAPASSTPQVERRMHYLRRVLKPNEREGFAGVPPFVIFKGWGFRFNGDRERKCGVRIPHPSKNRKDGAPTGSKSQVQPASSKSQIQLPFKRAPRRPGAISAC